MYQELISFFKSLALWLEIKDISIIYVRWNNVRQDNLKPFINIKDCMKDEGIVEGTKQDTKAFEASELTLKGLVVPLTSVIQFKDDVGHTRT